MTVFKAFLKVVRNNLFMIILYTVILVFFAVINVSSGGGTSGFEDSKPAVAIVNDDKTSPVTKNLVDYLEKNSEVTDVKGGGEALNDALFYREISCIVYIPKNYGSDVLCGKEPELKIKSTGNYDATLSQMILSHYIRIQNVCAKNTETETELIKNINSSLEEKTDVNVVSNIDESALSRASLYYSFASYSITACIIFIVCLVLSSFNERNIRKRTAVSCMDTKKYNMILLLSSGIYAFAVWLVYNILGIFIAGDVMFTERGMLYILNSFIFSISSLALAYMLSTILHNKNAVTSIVNVIALGSSFLCGAFVSTEYLPDWVLAIAHILPTYWYINTNDRLSHIETINFETVLPLLINMLIILGFSILFSIISSFITKKKRTE